MGILLDSKAGERSFQLALPLAARSTVNGFAAPGVNEVRGDRIEVRVAEDDLIPTSRVSNLARPFFD